MVISETRPAFEKHGPYWKWAFLTLNRGIDVKLLSKILQYFLNNDIHVYLSESHRIRQLIINKPNVFSILQDIVDTSDGCGAKFQALIVSPMFEGKPLLQRHRYPGYIHISSCVGCVQNMAK